jgi:hypothetical protein
MGRRRVAHSQRLSIYQSPPLSTPPNLEALPVNNLASRFVPLTADWAATRFAPHRTTATFELSQIGASGFGPVERGKKMHHWGTLFWGVVSILIVAWLIGMTRNKSEKGAIRSREYPSL